MKKPIFKIKLSQDDEYYFVLQAKNGKIVCTSEMYESKQACKNGINSVKRSIFAGVKDETVIGHVVANDCIREVDISLRNPGESYDDFAKRVHRDKLGQVVIRYEKE